MPQLLTESRILIEIYSKKTDEIIDFLGKEQVNKNK